MSLVNQLLTSAELAYARACQVLPGERVLAWRRARVARLAARIEVLGLLATVREALAQDRDAEAADPFVDGALSTTRFLVSLAF